MTNTIPALSKDLFWDCNINLLDYNGDKCFILERVFTRGTENDEKEVFEYYGIETIKKTVLHIKYLDKKTLNYLSVILNIPARNFRCYEKSLSIKPFGMF